VQIDRGGQVTFHGIGQLMIYPLLDLKRAAIGIRTLVTALEQSVVDLAAEFGIEAAARAAAPGVYVNGDKLASVGLRIRRGCSFHGMALNVDIDLEPFARINPCGYAGLQMTDLTRLGVGLNLEQAAGRLLPCFLRHLGIEDVQIERASAGVEGHTTD
jgi:lipoyl(octanoyl) transferase